MKNDLTYSFAKHIVWLVRKLHSGFLFKRSVAGIEAELIIHYAAYKFGFMAENARVCDMGSIYGFEYRGERIGLDANAGLFEFVEIKHVVDMIKKKYTNKNYIRAQLAKINSKYHIF